MVIVWHWYIKCPSVNHWDTFGELRKLYKAFSCTQVHPNWHRVVKEGLNQRAARIISCLFQSAQQFVWLTVLDTAPKSSNIKETGILDRFLLILSFRTLCHNSITCMKTAFPVILPNNKRWCLCQLLEDSVFLKRGFITEDFGKEPIWRELLIFCSTSATVHLNTF